jgi:hypothetical protein
MAFNEIILKCAFDEEVHFAGKGMAGSELHLLIGKHR